MNRKYFPQYSRNYFVKILIPPLAAMLLVGLLLAVFSLGPAHAQAGPAQSPKIEIASTVTVTNPISTYLPIIWRANESMTPFVLSPINNAVLNTLIPTFEWDMGKQPDNTEVCLVVDINPNPTGCQLRLQMGPDAHQTYRMWDNLQPSTHYYWRAGAVYNNDLDHPNWSQDGDFTTGPSGGTLLGAPTLLSPANNSKISPANAVLSWTPVNEAAAYNIIFHDKTKDLYYVLIAPEPQITFSPSEWGVLNPNTDYEWQVSAGNDYAWGNDSTLWAFSTTAAASSRVALASPHNYFDGRFPGQAVNLLNIRK